MQSKAEFIREATLRLYASSDWVGPPPTAVKCAEELYAELQKRGYGFLEVTPAVSSHTLGQVPHSPPLPEQITCPNCKGVGELYGGSHTFDCSCCGGSGKIKAPPRKP